MLFNNLFFRLRKLRSDKNNRKRLFYHFKTLYYDNCLFYCTKPKVYHRPNYNGLGYFYK